MVVYQHDCKAQVFFFIPPSSDEKSSVLQISFLIPYSLLLVPAGISCCSQWNYNSRTLSKNLLQSLQKRNWDTSSFFVFKQSTVFTSLMKRRICEEYQSAQPFSHIHELWEGGDNVIQWNMWGLSSKGTVKVSDVDTQNFCLCTFFLGIKLFNFVINI